MSAAYDHTQRGVLHYLVGFGAAACLAGALARKDDAPMFVMLIATAGALMLIAGAFGYLRVVDMGDRLAVQFGPVRLFGTSIPYADMVSAQLCRTTLLHGWGVHGLPFVGVTYNIHGYDCVRVTFRQPRGIFRLRHINIGTDDAEGLASFLASRIPSGAAS